MDKSFNDQELSDIMKEIEALEEEFTGEVENKATPVMEELAEMDESHSIPKTAHKKSTVVSLEKSHLVHSKSSGTSMSFKVQGDINLDLNFEIGGKTVSLCVSEDGLNICMDNGVTFHVPISDTDTTKKAA